MSDTTGPAGHAGDHEAHPPAGRPDEPGAQDLAHRLDPYQGQDDQPAASADLTVSHAAVPDPGLPPHEHRMADVDEKAARRAERQVSAMFGISALATLAFCVAFFAVPDDAVILGIGAQNAALGLTLGIALFAIGAAAIHWAKKLMPDVEIVEERKPFRSTDEDRTAMVETFKEGAAASGFGRRTLIRGSMLGALGLVGVPAIVLLRDLGPNPGNAPSVTLWDQAKEGMRIRVVNDVTFLPLRPEDIEVGALVNAMPENFAGSAGAAAHGEGEEAEGEEAEPAAELRYEGVPHGVEQLNARAHSSVIVVRMTPDEIRSQQGDNWDHEGILCFSKICTHIGCPINLYEKRTHHLLCPCHQSTYDLSDAAKVIFGPAARHLPQLALEVDDEGYLVASQPFAEPVGPSFWERS